jgi:AcrR family transcriptional regulator
MRAGTRDRLLDAAEELFFGRGIAATPIDAVLARAGVSPATMYRGFGGKDDLVAAALARRHAAWMQVWNRAAADASTPRARLLSVFDAAQAFRSGRDGARWCAFLGSASELADPPAQVAAAIATDTQALRERLTEHAAAVAPDDAEALADRILLVFSGTLAMRLRGVEGPELTGRAIAETLVDAVQPAASTARAARSPETSAP